MDKWGIPCIIIFFSGFFQVVFVWCVSHYCCGVCHIHDSTVIQEFMIYCSCSTNERNGTMGNINESVREDSWLEWEGTDYEELFLFNQ